MAKNTVIVSVLGDVRDLESKLGGAGGAFSTFGKVALGVAAAAVAAVAGIGIKSTQAASQMEQSAGAMASVFKAQNGEMTANAKAAAGALGLAQSEYATLATVLGSQMRNMGVDADQLGGKTHELIGLGADLSAQFGGSTSEAVSALSSLLRGERDPIERYGVSINEAAVKAKMAEMGLVGLTGEAEKNAKLSATLALLYAQTADAQGAFARESTTLAGAQQRLSAGTENLYAILGTSLLPAVTAVTAAIGQLVNKAQESAWFASLTASLSEASNAFADFVFGILNGTTTIDFGAILAGLLPAMIGGIQNAASWLSGGGLAPIIAGITESRSAMLDGALTLFSAIVAVLPQILPQLVAGIMQLVVDTVNMLVAAAPAILGAAVIAFGTLVESLGVILPLLITQLVTMLPLVIESILGVIPLLMAAAITLFTALVEAIPVVIPLLVSALVDLLPVLLASIISMIPAILDGAISMFMALVESLPVVIPVLLQAVIDLLPMLVKSLLSMIPVLLQAAIKLFTTLITAVPGILPQLIPALVGLAGPMIGALLSLIPMLVRAGVDLIGGLIKGLVQSAGAVGTALVNIAKGAVNGFLAFLGIKSPSRLMAGYGKNTVQGLVGGLTKNAHLVDAAMDDLSTRVGDGFNASLTAPEIDQAFAAHSLSSSSSHAGRPTVIVHLQTLNATAETGRVIVEAIRDYEDFGGRV